MRWASFSGHFGGPSFSWLRDAEMQHMISLIYAYTYPENWSLFPSECWYWLRICLNSVFQEMTSTISLDTWIVFIKDIAIFRADGERIFFQLLDNDCVPQFLKFVHLDTHFTYNFFKKCFELRRFAFNLLILNSFKDRFICIFHEDFHSAFIHQWSRKKLG